MNCTLLRSLLCLLGHSWREFSISTLNGATRNVYRACARCNRTEHIGSEPESFDVELCRHCGSTRLRGQIAQVRWGHVRNVFCSRCHTLAYWETAEQLK